MRAKWKLPPMSGPTLAGLSEREHWRRFARKERFVYTAAFVSGIVKVGYTDYPARRFGQLAWATGDTIVRAWTSALHLNAIQNERELIFFCRREGSNAGRAREFFTGVDLEMVVGFAEGLEYRQTSDVDVDAAMERHRQWVAAGYPLPESVRKPAQPELPLGGEA
jgi:hypothetical protein